jgi:hypothetical protein
MAVEAIEIGGTVAANSQGLFLSNMILKPIRLLAVQVSWNGSNESDSFSVFSTLSPIPVAQPQPGDPPVLRAMNVRTRVTTAFSIAIPVPTRRLVQPPLRFAFVFNNTSDTNERAVSCVIWYDTEE